MAKYRVQAPDGSVFQVEAPDGASQDEVLAYAQASYQPRSKFGGIPVASQPQSKFGGIPVDAPVVAGSGDFDDLIPDRRWQDDEIVAPARGDFDDLIPQRGGDFDDLIPAEGRTIGGSQLQSVKQAGTASRLMQLENALRKAHTLGNADHARAFAAEIRRMRETPKADFSNVRSSVSFDGVGASRRDPRQVRAMGGQGRPYAGPLLSGPGAGPSKSDAEIARIMAQSERGAVRRTPEQAKRDAFRQLPAPVRGLIGMGGSVGRLGMGVGQVIGVTDEQDVIRRRQDDAYMRGDLAATLGGIAGDIGLMAAPGGAVARTLGTTGRTAVASNAALAAGYNALQPVAHQESRGQNAAVGGAFGAGGQMVGNVLGHVGKRAANAVPEMTQVLGRRAQVMGIPLHASQVSDSLPVKVAASAGKYLPFSGYGGAAKRQQEAFNRAVGRTFGVDAPKITDDVMRNARQAMSRQFEGIYERNAVPLTEKGVRKLAEIEREASRRLTNDEAQVLRNQLDDILANAEDGVFTGQKYQAVRSALKKAEDKSKLGIAVRDMRQALDDLAAESVGPQDAATLKALRSQWANFRTVENARKQAAGASDDIRPGSLWPLIRNGSTKEMRELARMGQTILKDPIADSGTAQRSLVYNLLMGGTSIANPALIPMIGQAALGGATLGRAANSNALAKLLLRESRGVPTGKLAKLLQGANPRVMPAAGAAVNRANQGALEFDVVGGVPVTDEQFEREYGYRPR